MYLRVERINITNEDNLVDYFDEIGADGTVVGWAVPAQWQYHGPAPHVAHELWRQVLMPERLPAGLFPAGNRCRQWAMDEARGSGAS